MYLFKSILLIFCFIVLNSIKVLGKQAINYVLIKLKNLGRN